MNMIWFKAAVLLRCVFFTSVAGKFNVFPKNLFRRLNEKLDLMKSPFKEDAELYHAHNYSTLNLADYRSEQVKIGQIALFMRLFKKMDSSGESRFSFPQQIRIYTSGEVEDACGSGDLKQCVDVIFSKLRKSYFFKKQTDDFWGKNEQNEGRANTRLQDMKDSGKGYSLQISSALFDRKSEPFKTRIDQSIYLVQAMYYLCWYTNVELEVLAHLPICDYEDEWHYTITFPDSKPANMFPDVLDEERFRCARFSFCPDPCCASKTLRERANQCAQDAQNPCKHYRHKECHLPSSRNQDLMAMARNQFNFTCDCDHVGFKYNEKFHTCVDHDDCAEAAQNGEGDLCGGSSETVVTAMGSTCANTIGGHRCVCPLGFYMVRGENPSCAKLNKPEFVKELASSGERVKSEYFGSGKIWGVFMFIQLVHLQV